MYDPEMRKDCPMRGNLGNCSPVGGFCMDAVSDEICEAIHNAYDHGFHDAVRMLKEQDNCENCAIAIEDRQLVVRCKDCKYYPNGDGSTTWLPCREIITPPGWFCADGEKKRSTL